MTKKYIEDKELKDPKLAWLLNLTDKYKKRSNIQIVLDTLEEAMIRKELSPGDQLPSETVLSQQLRVGKSSVREAIKMLEGIGVIEVIQGKGTFIAHDFKEAGSSLLVFQLMLAESSPKELVDFRYLFEPIYMEMAMRQFTADDFKVLEQILDDTKRHIENRQQTALDDFRFHDTILQATRNSIVISIGIVINKMLHNAFEKAMQVDPYLVLQDHILVYTALKSEDAAQLKRAVTTSLDNWIKIFFSGYVK